MQSLDVISVNLWQIIISLLNLLILFLIIKKFLFKPVQKMLANRQEELNNKYKAADDAVKRANMDEQYWKEKKERVEAEADSIIQSATDTAKKRSEKIVDEAKEKAEGIVRSARTEAELELEKAEDTIKREIVDVSAQLAQKILSREINIDDHRSMIDSVIESIGDDK